MKEDKLLAYHKKIKKLLSPPSEKDDKELEVQKYFIHESIAGLSIHIFSTNSKEPELIEGRVEQIIIGLYFGKKIKGDGWKDWEYSHYAVPSLKEQGWQGLKEFLIKLDLTPLFKKNEEHADFWVLFKDTLMRSILWSGHDLKQLTEKMQDRLICEFFQRKMQDPHLKNFEHFYHQCKKENINLFRRSHQEWTLKLEKSTDENKEAFLNKTKSRISTAEDNWSKLDLWAKNKFKEVRYPRTFVGSTIFIALLLMMIGIFTLNPLLIFSSITLIVTAHVGGKWYTPYNLVPMDLSIEECQKLFKKSFLKLQNLQEILTLNIITGEYERVYSSHIDKNKVITMTETEVENSIKNEKLIQKENIVFENVSLDVTEKFIKYQKKIREKTLSKKEQIISDNIERKKNQNNKKEDQVEEIENVVFKDDLKQEKHTVFKVNNQYFFIDESKKDIKKFKEENTEKYNKYVEQFGVFCSERGRDGIKKFSNKTGEIKVKKYDERIEGGLVPAIINGKETEVWSFYNLKKKH